MNLESYCEPKISSEWWHHLWYKWWTLTIFFPFKYCNRAFQKKGIMKSIFRVFSLLLFLLVVSVNSQKEENIDSYYLDSLGHICTDTVDTVQKVEYDSQIHCTVSPMTVCDDDDDFEASKNSVLGRRIGQQQFNHPSDDLIVEGNDPIATFQRRQQTSTKSAGEGKQVCHTMSVKECKTVNRPRESKVLK